MLRQMDHQSRLLNRLVHLVAAQDRSQGSVQMEADDDHIQACVIQTAPGQVQLAPQQLDLVIINRDREGDRDGHGGMSGGGGVGGGVTGAGDSSGPTWA